MSKRILVPTDGSAWLERCFATARRRRSSRTATCPLAWSCA